MVAKTNRWKLEELTQDRIVITRVQDDIPIASMFVTHDGEDGLLNREEAIDVAEQIIEKWNSDCMELEEGDDD